MDNGYYSFDIPNSIRMYFVRKDGRNSDITWYLDGQEVL